MLIELKWTASLTFQVSTCPYPQNLQKRHPVSLHFFLRLHIKFIDLCETGSNLDKSGSNLGCARSNLYLKFLTYFFNSFTCNANSSTCYFCTSIVVGSSHSLPSLWALWQRQNRIFTFRQLKQPFYQRFVFGFTAFTESVSHSIIESYGWRQIWNLLSPADLAFTCVWSSSVKRCGTKSC